MFPPEDGPGVITSKAVLWREEDCPGGDTDSCVATCPGNEEAPTDDCVEECNAQCAVSGRDGAGQNVNDSGLDGASIAGMVMAGAALATVAGFAVQRSKNGGGDWPYERNLLTDDSVEIEMSRSQTSYNTATASV
jgi:hypothetical protein